jgi:hypothetical protein
MRFVHREGPRGEMHDPLVKSEGNFDVTFGFCFEREEEKYGKAL